MVMYKQFGNENSYNIILLQFVHIKYAGLYNI